MSRPVSPGNPRPFLRARVAQGLLPDGTAPLGDVAQTVERVVFDFGQESLARWQKNSDQSPSAARYEIQGELGQECLHAVVSQLIGWETLSSPHQTEVFPPNHTLTCFQAKGSPRTKQLMVEWSERDGSRWIATVDLAPEWRTYALPPAAFRPWTPPPGLVTAELDRASGALTDARTPTDQRYLEYFLAGTEPGALRVDARRLFGWGPIP